SAAADRRRRAKNRGTRRTTRNCPARSACRRTAGSPAPPCVHRARSRSAAAAAARRALPRRSARRQQSRQPRQLQQATRESLSSALCHWNKVARVVCKDRARDGRTVARQGIQAARQLQFSKKQLTMWLTGGKILTTIRSLSYTNPPRAAIAMLGSTAKIV